VAPACEHRGVALQADAGDLGIELQADADQLRQLLMNLLLNGLEAAGPKGWVRIELHRTQTEALIRVFDSGSGPQAHLVDRLFEPFVTGKPEGIGLGLAVAKKIAESHGGNIRYLGGGPTCFEVRLPATAHAAEPPPTADHDPLSELARSHAD
jgi:signal transduction histidine kinase